MKVKININYLNNIIKCLCVILFIYIIYILIKRTVIDNFIVLDNHHASRSNNNKNIKIPKIIWQTHKTNDLPQSSYDNINRMIQLNPDYEHNFYTDEDMLKFLQDNFDESVINAYNKIKPGAGKADIWRLADGKQWHTLD